MPIPPNIPLKEQLRSMDFEDLVEYTCRLAAEPAADDPQTVLKLDYPDNLLADIFADINTVNTFVKPYDFEPSLNYVLSQLTPREQEVLKMRYQEHKTLETIAKEKDVTRERIRQINAKALRRLRHPVRYQYITCGISGTIDNMVNQRLALLTNKFEEIYHKSYERGYADGLAKAEANASIITDPDKSLKDITLEEMDLSVRSYNCLQRARITTLADIARMTEDDLCRIRNMGQKSIEEVIDKCAVYGVKIPRTHQTI